MPGIGDGGAGDVGVRAATGGFGCGPTVGHGFAASGLGEADAAAPAGGFGEYAKAEV